jgi:type VI protein secretion system component Hcp
MRQALAGNGHNNAVVYFTQLDRTTGAIVGYLEFDLTNVFISGFSQSSNGNPPSESLSLNFTKFTMTAHSAGSADQSVTYDLATAQIS